MWEYIATKLLKISGCIKTSILILKKKNQGVILNNYTNTTNVLSILHMTSEFLSLLMRRRGNFCIFEINSY